MQLEIQLSNNLDPTFRQQLISNFEIIQRCFNQQSETVDQDKLDKALKAMRNMVYTINAGSDNGDSSVETKLARTSIKGKNYPTIAARLDAIERAIINIGGAIDV
ncbi:hypothetical protein LCIT_03630 [Leuconostoc citreum]|uniref:Uncharacterized protein n=1 Tax=Leuconostoc citreum TaxID=33964 RepID=A0A5A5TX95_LEUCI|nr:hypothetical protein [Leuconostoc citreum]MCP1276949.1 hypothetical protein [Leuconostoc citreum]GDZ83121.1 hypothetical protein LCIT_03630 [Leuconostoc citreum]